MTTNIINEKSKKGRIIIDLVRELSCGKIINDDCVNLPNNKTIKAVQEAREGKTTKLNDFDVVEEKSYNPAFVKRVLSAKEEIKQGKGVKISIEDLWK